MRLSELLRIPSLAEADVDGVDRIDLHRKILEQKPMIREVFAEFQTIFKDCEARFFAVEGIAVEIGAGAAPMRDADARVLATDIVYSPHLDCVLDAQRMPFASNSVRSIFAQHCFHHLPDPDLFFEELRRVLVPGGGIAMIEPYFGPVARVLFKRLFASEDFDMNAPDWRCASGPMSRANQALSYMVFHRDRAIFERKYPDLEIVAELQLGNYIRYLLSGGLNFRQLAPNAATPLLKFTELALKPFNSALALHYLLVLRKRRATCRQAA